MSKKDKTLKGIKAPSRRKFFKAAAATGAVAAATLAMPSIAKAATTLKVQAAWGGGIFLENAQAYVKRVNEMSGGSTEDRSSSCKFCSENKPNARRCA